MSLSYRVLPSAFVAVFLSAPIVHAVETVWIGGPAGNWSEASHWSTGVVPNDAATNVTIDDDLFVDSVAVLDQDATIQNLVVDLGDALNIDPSRLLTVNSARIAGSINMAASTQLLARDLVWIQPEGALTLADVSSRVFDPNPFYLLRNEGQLEGAGVFNKPALINEGMVVANVPGKQLQMDLFSTTTRGLHFNRGDMIAENAGALSIISQSSNFTPLENATGLIEARGDSTALLQRIRLVGGLVSTSTAGGTNEGAVTLSFSTLENLTLVRNVKLDSVMFSGTVVNNTRLEETAANNFYVEGIATVSGDGWLEVNNGVISAPPGNFPTTLGTLPGLINDVNHTIKGPGVINPSTATDRIALDNRGIVEVDAGLLQWNLRSTTQSSSTLAPSSNSGTIRAKSGGTIEILGTSLSDVLTNVEGLTAGVVEAGVDSTIVLGNMSLRGGILRAVAPAEGSSAQAGKVITSGTQFASLEDIRLEGRIGETPSNSRWSLAGIIENTQALTGQIAIAKPTTLTGGGEVHLQSPGGISSAASTFDGFYDPLINENNLIHGSGGIGSGLVFINRGIVQADIPNGMLAIAGNDAPGSFDAQPFVNSGEFKAINGGKMAITAQIINFEGSDLGTIHAGNGSEVQITEVSGGLLSTEGTGKIVVGTNGALVNVHNLGSLSIGTSGATKFLGTTVNDGTVTQTSATTVSFGGPFAELTGSGVWGTSNIALAFVVGTSSAPSIFTHGAQHTIQGGGKINLANGAFINHGTIIANSTTPLTIAFAQGTTFQQRGSLTVNSTRTMEVQINDELFVNRGTVNALGTFRLRRMNAGSAQFRNAAGASVNLKGTISFESAVSSLNPAGVFWNQSLATLAGTGTIDLVQSNINSPGLFRNSGVLRPEGETAQPGRIFIDGNFQQDATGVLEIDLAGLAATEFDAVLLKGQHASLAGQLAVSLVSTYDPQVGDEFTIIDTQGGTISGGFDHLDVLPLFGRWWSLDYISDKVVLNVEQITADFDGNGIVDDMDLDDWQAAYGIDASGDADADGDSDGRDFLAWQRQYGSGVATEGLIASVPEPSGLVLVSACGFAACALQRGRKPRSIGHSTLSISDCHSEGSATTRRISVRPSHGLLALLVVLCACRVASAVEATWVGGPAGTWSDSMNWSTGVVPNLATTNVTIDDDWSQDSVVVLDQNATIQNFVLDAGDRLNLNPSRVLTTNSVIIAGDVSLAATSQLKASDFIWIEPEGTLTLADTAQIVRGTFNQDLPIWNQGRIVGAGGFLANDYRFAFNNDGAVVANVPGKQLQLRFVGTNDRGVHLNTGELIAENGGELRVFGQGDTANQAFFTPLENTNGLIEARGDSKIMLSTIRLVGGQLSTTSAGGTNEGLITFSSVLFENVTLSGNLALNSVTFSDRVVNNTDIVVNTFFVEGYATISGEGSMDLNGGLIGVPGPQFGGQFVGTPGFVNDVNHTIKGPGSINSSFSSSTSRLAFDNRGLIECEDTSPFLNPDTLQINLRSAGSTSAGSSINSGTIRAHSGGRIEILGTSLNDELTNYSGTKLGLVEAGVDSTVVLGTMILRGGVLRSAPVEEGGAGQSGKVITTPTSSTSAKLENLRLEGTIGDTVSNSRWNLAGNIENTGVLKGQIAIAKPTSLTGGGEVRLEQGGWIRRIEPVSSGNKIPLVNENNLIHGEGEIGRDLAFTNRGVVQADVADKTLILYPSFSDPPLLAFNSGVFRAIDGGKLVVRAQVINYEGSDPGTIHAGDGSVVEVTQVNGGILSTEGTGQVVVAPGVGGVATGPYLNDVHNRGTLVFDSFTYLRGKIVNDGTVTQNDPYKVYVGAPFTELTGSGVWGGPNSLLAMEVGTFSGGQFVHGPDHTIQGRGVINVVNGSFVNYGTITAHSDVQSLDINLQPGATMVQRGTLNAPSNPFAKTIEITTHQERFVNEGLINAGGYVSVTRNSDGPLEFINATGAEIRLGLSLGVHSQDTAASPVTVWNQEGGLITGEGSFNLKGDSSQYQPLLRNSGTIRPGGGQIPYGQLFANSDFLQDSTGALDFDLAGPKSTGWYDRLYFLDGEAVLAGGLNVSLAGDYVPEVGDEFDLLFVEGGTISGTFDTFTAPALSGRWWSLDYLADKVVLSVQQITADFNLDGLVDGLDLQVWQTGYQAGDGSADADGDGDTDGADFLAWQRQYGSGLSVAESLTVPEPSVFLLIAMFSLSLTAARQFC